MGLNQEEAEKREYIIKENGQIKLPLIMEGKRVKVLILKPITQPKLIKSSGCGAYLYVGVANKGLRVKIKVIK